MAHEHVNSAREIEELAKHFFSDVDVSILVFHAPLNLPIF